MKTKQELKEDLHNLINSIDDEEVLNMLNEVVVPYVMENKSTYTENDSEELSEEQQRRLSAAIKNAEEGKVISIEEFYSRMETWRTK